jgi:signal transduction histidine kinase
LRPGLDAGGAAEPDIQRWKYSGKNASARIEVGTQVRGECELTYYVRDNGVGFDAAEGKKIFEPFHRLHDAEFAGSGIGLATVAKIIQRHGGKVWAESSPGQGATFYFSLGSTAAKP